MARFSSSLLLLALAVVCLGSLFSSASAAHCLAYIPPLKKGAACGFDTYCDYGLFCSRDGTCTPQVANGQPCYSNNQCPAGSSCKGPQGAKICVAPVNLGDTCSTDPQDTVGYCPYDCPIDNICRGGKVGDACTATNQCNGNLTCTNGVCTPLNDGERCISSYDCKPQSFCNSYNGKCTSKKTFGQCSSEDECAYGYFCLGFQNGDASSCHPLKSREVGEYCGDDNHCAGGMRCLYNKCAAKKLAYCQDNSECGRDQFCACGSDQLDYGYGTCRAYPCASKINRFTECIAMNCKDFVTGFSGSCAYRNCGDDVEAFLPCARDF